jgi:hypothetical protein
METYEKTIIFYQKYVYLLYKVVCLFCMSCLSIKNLPNHGALHHILDIVGKPSMTKSAWRSLGNVLTYVAIVIEYWTILWKKI